MLPLATPLASLPVTKTRINSCWITSESLVNFWAPNVVQIVMSINLNVFEIFQSGELTHRTT